MKKILLLFIAVFLLVSCGNNTPETINIDSEDNVLGSVNIEDKKTFISFVTTWCPYCQQEMPILDEFYRDHKDNVNMKVYVTDGEYYTEDYEIPQDTSRTMDYFQELSGETCTSIPSYIILDASDNIIEAKCGVLTSYEELEEKLLK